MKQKIDYKKVSIALSLSALGLAIGSLVSFMKLPVFLDTIGIMLATLLLGWRYGLLSAIVTAILAFFFVSPVVPFYFGTMVGLVFYTEFSYKINYYSNLSKVIVTGVGHGVVGTILSLPVTYLVFGGFTSSGNDLIVSFLVSQDFSILWSVVMSLTVFAIIDRVLTSMFCYSVLNTIPKRFTIENGLRYFKNK